MKFRALLVVLCLLPVFGVAASEIEETYHSLVQALDDGQTDAEVDALSAFARKHPDSIWGQRAALVVARRSDTERALRHWKLVDVEKFPNSADLLVELADMQENARERGAAEQTLERAALGDLEDVSTRKAILRLAENRRTRDDERWKMTLQGLIQQAPETEEAVIARAMLLTDLEPRLFIPQGIKMLAEENALPEKAFKLVQGHLLTLRRSDTWAISPSDTKTLFAVQRRMYEAGERERLLDIDAIYVTDHLSGADRHWSVLLHAMGRRHRGDEAGCIRIAGRILDENDKLPVPLRKEAHYQLLRAHFSARNYAQVIEHAQAWDALEGEAGDAREAYRLWAFAQRNQGQDFSAVAKKALQAGPANDETAAIFRDLIVEAYLEKRHEDGLKWASMFLDNTDCEDWHCTEMFQFWKARHLLALERKAEALQLLQGIDSYDIYGAVGRELLAVLSGGKAVGYLTRPVGQIPTVDGLPEHLRLWLAIAPKQQDDTELTAAELQADFAAWQESPHYVRFQEAILQRHSRMLYREGEALGDAFPGDAGLLFHLANLANAASEHFFVTTRLFRAARLAEERGTPIRAPEYWKLVFPWRFRELIEAGSQANGQDPYLVASLIMQESNFQLRRVSGAGAQGLMQIMPGTATLVARKEGITDFHRDDVFVPEKNIRLGTAYLKGLAERYAGKIPVMLAGYNAGPGNADRWLKTTPGDDLMTYMERLTFAETRGYTRRIMRNYAFYRQLYGDGKWSSFVFPGHEVEIQPVDGKNR